MKKGRSVAERRETYVLIREIIKIDERNDG